MASVRIDNLEPGMVLAADVKDSKGRLLLTKGVTIEAKHLLVFQTWGVTNVSVEGDDDLPADPLPAEISQKEMNQAREALLASYRHTDLKHPAIAELFRLASIRKVRNDRKQQ
ncbi:MAG TPA: hypothetical protein VJ955_06280 [Desulfuromonadales bacterium]|nr:hypothetical protein [Desulfuromonadales bacterium]